jgi:histidinol phosphatase-like enzyme (inositol monophosphatase family)
MARLDEEERRSIIATAHALADAARAATLPHFRHAALTAETKETHRFDPVTAADRESELRMREIIAARRPLDGILGEEFPSVASRNGLTWVLDPIDGTRGFLSGTPTWGVLIALADETGPVFGIVDQPYIRERFVGGFGLAEVTGPSGAAALRARGPRPLSDAILFTTFPEVGTTEEGAAFRRLSGHVRLTRYGTDCYAYALIAAGTIDLVVEAGLQSFDVMAPIAVIEAAGGVVTDWTGGPAHRGGRILAAANRNIHRAALEILNG